MATWTPRLPATVSRAAVGAWRGRLPVGGPRLRLGVVTIAIGPIWLLLAPLVTWLLATLYLPIMAPVLAGPLRWLVALALLPAIGACLVVHTLGHALLARQAGRPPIRLALEPWGDAAQTWSAATPRDDALAALAGPAVSILLALAAYVLWDRQIDPLLDAVFFLLAAFNLALVIVNLAPGFPFDGGRLTRAAAWALLGAPARATRLSRALGHLQAAALLAWGVYLLLQPVRFNLETGGATIAVAALFWYGATRPGSAPAVAPSRPLRRPLRRWAAVALLALLLAVPSAMLAPTLHGLHAPGSAEAVAPMISVAGDHRYPSDGRFLLTTVVAQTPILVWQWLQALNDPTLRLLPPAAVVPQNTTPQELMSVNYRLLDESTLAATVVGMRLAGYEPRLHGEAVAVISVLPQSRARGLLQPGDHILALNGAPTELASDLITQVQAQTDADSVTLLIERDGRQERVQAPLMAPEAPDDPPRLGITVRTIGLTADLPFPVEITPKKILGGPSAGLMFTLTLYDLLTPGDLTQGRIIAGTGTISMDGAVGPIGGVAQKVAAAEHAGASYFLTPPANAPEARRAAHNIVIIEVASAQAAIEALRALPPPAR